VTARTYPSPAAFKQALEQRLRSGGPDLARRRQLLVFDRFLARVSAVLGEAATLKGGLVLELRLDRARTTRDVDLRLVDTQQDVLARLQEAGRRDLGDFLSFELRRDDDHPAIRSPGVAYDGERFRAEGRLGGKLYGQPFGVDVAFGDPMLGDPEVVVADDVLGFAGIPPPTLRLYPVETHLAEKLHAYTVPRPHPNSRVKDLPDLALLATTRPLEAARLRTAFLQTFDFRRTHALPARLPAPPLAWATPYAAMAREDGLPWLTLEAVLAATRAFVDPVLAGQEGLWNPSAWRWEITTIGR
jgi:hypothetical protein